MLESIVLQPSPSAVFLTETGMTQFWDRDNFLPPVEAHRHHVSRLARTLPSVSLHTRSHANGDPHRGTHRMPPSGGCRQDRETSRVMRQRLRPPGPSPATPPAAVLHAATGGRSRPLPEGSDRTRRAKWRLFCLYVGERRSKKIGAKPGNYYSSQASVEHSMP